MEHHPELRRPAGAGTNGSGWVAPVASVARATSVIGPWAPGPHDERPLPAHPDVAPGGRRAVQQLRHLPGAPPVGGELHVGDPPVAGVGDPGDAVLPGGQGRARGRDVDPAHRLHDRRAGSSCAARTSPRTPGSSPAGRPPTWRSSSRSAPGRASAPGSRAPAAAPARSSRTPAASPGPGPPRWAGTVVNSSAPKVARETAPGRAPPARASTSLTRTPFQRAVEIRSQPKGASSHLATKLLMHSRVLVTSTAGRRRRLA